MKELFLLGIPELASEHGEMVDHMLLTVTYFMAVLGIFWGGFIVYAIWRFRRKKNPRASYHGMTSHWSTHVEIGVIITEIILLLGFAFPLWGNRIEELRYPTGPDVVRLRAVGEKFKWTFHYPGDDLLFGRVDRFLISPSNPLGIDPDDPNGFDDRISEFDMGIPVGRPVVVEVTSKDVIHGLHLLPLRMQQDAIPGTESHIWFRATKPSPEDGWDILCAQLCGTGHANMAAKLHVLDDAAFDEWIKGRRLFNPEKAAAATPVPVAAANGSELAPDARTGAYVAR
jgi:cytochrome c oxidase subunit 2